METHNYNNIIKKCSIPQNTLMDELLNQLILFYFKAISKLVKKKFQKIYKCGK